jgi:hypothetical protein
MSICAASSIEKSRGRQVHPFFVAKGEELLPTTG